MTQTKPFSSYVIDNWEKDDCVNFAVALARKTNWTLNVDWITDKESLLYGTSSEQLIPVRAYVQDNHDNIFDVRGIFKLEEFHNAILKPTTMRKLERSKAFLGSCGVITRFYSEENLRLTPLKVQPDETKIQKALHIIENNQDYLSHIPTRTSRIPAYEAAQFTFGKCAIYAEALKNLHGISPTGILAKTWLPMYQPDDFEKNGYIHSVGIHADEIVEDVWGEQAVAEVAARFGLSDFYLDEKAHHTAVANLKKNSPKEYDETYIEAVELIKNFR